MRNLLLAGAALGAVLAACPVAGATTIDFTTLPLYTPVTTLDGVTFSLSGGQYGSGIPETGGFGYPNLANSPDGEYPTSEDLNVAFSSAVSDVSFTFNNYGVSYSGRGASYFYAFNASDTLVSSGFIGDVSPFDGYVGGLVTVPGSGITQLEIDNGSGGTSSWLFGVFQLTFTPTKVPEPSSLALLGVGLAGLGFFRRRRKAA